MILIPVGHEQSALKRRPWVTFGLMGLCLILFLLSGRADLAPADDAELEQRAEEAVEYFFAHPYLELEPEFTALAFPGDEGDGEDSFLAMLRETMPPPTDETTRSTEQAELDRLTARTLDAVADHPLNRWELVPDSIRPTPSSPTCFSTSAGCT